MFITNDLRWDGFGAQFQSIIWSILWAECQGATFFYSEIEKMVNDTGDEKKFIEDANECINLRDKYPSVKQTPHGATTFALKWPYFYKQIEHNMEFFHDSASFRKIQDAYFTNKTNPFDKEHLHIAVHVRRPLSFDNRVEGAQTPDTYYLYVMDFLYHQYKDSTKPILFHLYSTGEESAFEAYRKYPIQFHLKDDTFQSFIGMSFADILVTSASSFSYTAALLSKGEIIYQKFWHPPRGHWKVMV